MARPILLTVDDDPDVLRAIERDLRRRYSDRYRVMSASSGSEALRVLAELRRRNEPVALLLVDYRMPQLNGVELLSQTLADWGDSKRVLLTAYADTEAAIRAINEAHLNHYLLKPWDPPESNLYPIIDDLLDEWLSSYHPPLEGMRVLGSRWSPRSYELREFLARNHVPYHWLDVDAADREPEVKRALESVPPDDVRLPVVLCEDGTCLHDPTVTEIAERVGLRTRAEGTFYDLTIVGGGPAGLAAGVYGASEGLKTVMVEREAPGGQAGLSSRIENYLGFPSGLSGADLAFRAVTQAKRFGVEILSPQEVLRVRADGPYRVVTLADGSEISSHALLIATGVQWKKLDIPGMDRLAGAGVYYGAGSTEAITCRDEDVYVVGGANSAGQAAMNFSRYAHRVVMLIRGQSLSATMSKYLIDEIGRTPNIEVYFQTQLVEVHGRERLEEISIACSPAGSIERVPCASLFIFIGAMPRTDWLEGFVERDSHGFVFTGSDLIHEGKRPKSWTEERDPTLLEASLPGVYAIGDVRHGSIKRVASGVGEGSIAIQFVHKYLAKV